MSEQSWSAAETWVWERVRVGQVADFHQHLGKLDPNVAEGWDDARRRLDTAFIRRIFYDRTLRDDIPPEGVRVAGAWFPDGLRLPNARLHQRLWLDHCRFERKVDLSSHTTEGSLSFEGSSFAEAARGEAALVLSGSRIGGELVLADVTAAGSVHLWGADIKGRLVFFGATVAGKLTMGSLRVGQDLFMCRNKGKLATFADVDLTGADVKGRFILSGTTVAGALVMNGLKVEQSLFMRGSKERPATFADVDLTTADVKGQLVLDGAIVAGKLAMDSLRVGQSLFMRGNKEEPATFTEVDLMAADVKGQLILSGAAVTGKLVMAGLRVGESLTMSGGELPTRLADVDLTGADVKGNLGLSGVAVAGRLMMPVLRVGQNLLMRGSPNRPTTIAKDVDLNQARVAGGVDLGFASLGGMLTLTRVTVGADLHLDSLRCASKGRGVVAFMQFLNVGGTLNLEGATAWLFDLSGAKTAGELQLRSMVWLSPVGSSRLILHNAHASVLDEDFAKWPAHVDLELDGFTYDRVKGVGGTEEMKLTRREWRERRIGGWFDRDSTYTPQPYEQLAGVLRRAGEPAKAATVLYAGRERARRHERESYMAQRKGRAGSWASGAVSLRLPGWYGWRHTGLTLLKWTIGYGLGLRYFRCLWWIAGLTLLGAVVLQVDAMHIHFAEGVVYSFQRLLPPLARIEEFPKTSLNTFSRWYFYIHQLIGYVLAGFLAAGLAGLTQKT